MSRTCRVRVLVVYWWLIIGLGIIDNDIRFSSDKTDIGCFGVAGVTVTFLPR